MTTGADHTRQDGRAASSSSERMADRAYEEIQRLLRSQGLRPGERTSVAALAERLELGKMPVKDAVSRLASEGFLEVSPRRGTYVPTRTAGDVREMFALRRLLEGHAANKAAREVTPAELAELRDLLEAMERESISAPLSQRSVSRFIDADVKFHTKIVALARSRLLDRMYAALDVQIQIATYLLRARSDGAIDRHREHLAIFDALSARDGARLRRALTDHAKHVESRVLHSLDD